jgi:transposase-like protein
MAQKTIGNNQRRTSASNATESVAPLREICVMKGRRPVHTAELAQRILGQLSGGRSLRAVCRDHGTPSLNTVLKWVSEDRAGFAARYRRARETGGGGTGRPTLYTPELADLILDELAGGRTLADVCGDPGMPAAGTVRLWVIENREGFAAHYTTARQFGDDAMAHQILDIVDNRRHDWILRRKPNGETEMILDPHRIRRARLRFMARRWLLSKALQRKHGAPRV